MHFTIPVEPITKKNHQRIVNIPIGKGKTRPAILPSKQYSEYEKKCQEYIPDWGITYTVNIAATFYMRTRRRVDLVNLEEALCDVLVKYGCLEDDNSNIIVSMDGSRVEYDKINPRTEVVIERVEV